MSVLFEEKAIGGERVLIYFLLNTVQRFMWPRPI